MSNPSLGFHARGSATVHLAPDYMPEVTKRQPRTRLTLFPHCFPMPKPLATHCILSQSRGRMKNRVIFAVAAFALVILAETSRAGSIGPSDWPAWRGPTRDGIAAAGQNPPTQWSETE